MIRIKNPPHVLNETMINWDKATFTEDFNRKKHLFVDVKQHICHKCQ